MVNITIYLKKEYDAKEIVMFLLEKKLIASFTLDINNVSYKLENGVLTELVYNVITSQSKSLLFNDILKALESKTGEETLVISTPIVGSSKVFDELIKRNTLPV